jgi:hypothetical protein
MSDEPSFESHPAVLLLAEIDAQQDDLLRQLDQLNERIEGILRREIKPPAPLPKAA